MTGKELQERLAEMRRSEGSLELANFVSQFKRKKDSMTNWQSANFNGGVMTRPRNLDHPMI